mmetsp:Transcript_12428/g.36088  ORF Transcript_12428/g.36088 Transcript_12428/m.36088 type:complete len:202 (+) Transcript_12428:163-768(+)
MHAQLFQAIVQEVLDLSCRISFMFILHPAHDDGLEQQLQVRVLRLHDIGRDRRALSFQNHGLRLFIFHSIEWEGADQDYVQNVSQAVHVHHLCFHMRQTVFLRRTEFALVVGNGEGTCRVRLAIVKDESSTVEVIQLVHASVVHENELGRRNIGVRDACDPLLVRVVHGCNSRCSLVGDDQLFLGGPVSIDALVAKDGILQ